MTKSNPKVWPTTEHGCHQATYSGWECDDVIISAGGYVNGVYVPASEVWGLAGLYDQLSPEVQAEMPMPDGYPGDWNDKILELKKKGVSDEDEELLDALWVSGEVCDGEVTIYGTDDGVTRLDEDDLRGLGLDRIDDDDDDDDEEDEEPTTSPTDDDEPKMTTNSSGLKVTTYPTTPHGVHWASYPGWEGDDEIISDGGYVDGVYIRPAEVESAGLYDQLSEEVQAEMEPLCGCWPGDWNGKIIELRGNVSPRDEELLSALWIAEEVYDGEVTVYGTDSDVSEMDEDDFRLLGLSRIESDEDEDDEDEDDM